MCTGSVFKSWHLIKEGFVKCLQNSDVKEVNLVTVNKDSTIGAALLAAKLSGHNISIDSNKYVSELEHIKLN